MKADIQFRLHGLARHTCGRQGDQEVMTMLILNAVTFPMKKPVMSLFATGSSFISSGFDD